MSNQRAAMQRRNGNQFNQPQYAPAPPIQKVRTAQFSQPVPQVQQRGQPQEQLQAPQPGVIMTVNEAITRITKRLVYVENKVADFENGGLSSSASANSTSILADDTAINDILERINEIEDWINSNNFEGYAKQLQLIQSEFNKQTRLQNDRILKLETEMKKKQQLAHPLPPPIEQHQEVSASATTTAPRPRRFGGNKNIIQTYNPTVLDLNIDGQLISDLDTTTDNNDSVE